MGDRSNWARAFRWSSGAGPGGPALLALGLGVGLPVLGLALVGHEPFGAAVAVGGLLAGATSVSVGLAEQVRDRVVGLIVVCAATLAALLVARQVYWTAVAMAGLVGAVAMVGGYSRPLAMAAGRFVVAFAILQNLAEGETDPVRLLALVAVGALWNACLALIFGAIIRALAGGKPAAPPAASLATAGQKWRRWRRLLGQAAGWQYPLRLAMGFGLAGAARTAWPGHHFGWIVVTVAILCQRPLEVLPLKVVERSLGVLVGVAVTALLVAQSPPTWGLALLMAVLAALGPWLRERNYIVYAASVTPLVLLLLGAGRPVEISALTDRMVSTLLGAALVVTANLAAISLVPSGRLDPRGSADPDAKPPVV